MALPGGHILHTRHIYGKTWVTCLKPLVLSLGKGPLGDGPLGDAPYQGWLTFQSGLLHSINAMYLSGGGKTNFSRMAWGLLCIYLDIPSKVLGE